jgi:hypothetical protein
MLLLCFKPYSFGDELKSISIQNGGSLLFYIGLKNIRTFFGSMKDKVTVLKGIEKTFLWSN